MPKKNKAKAPEQAAIDNVLTQRNQNLNWVQRGMNPQANPYLTDPQGNIMTHQLSYGNDDQGYYVYPNIIQNENGQLQDLDPLEAQGWALESNTAMRVPSKKIAEQYSQNGLVQHDNGGRVRKRAVAISYDFQGNPINPQQDPALTFQPINLQTGNGQQVQMRLGEQRDPAPQFQPIQQAPQQQGWARNPDGSFAMNTQYLNQQAGGIRGNDAYNPIQNTNRSYAYEGTYGNRYMEDGGKVEPVTVENKNDPRYKAYQDSMAAYNFSQSQLKNLRVVPGTWEVNTDKAKIKNVSGPLNSYNNKEIATEGDYTYKKWPTDTWAGTESTVFDPRTGKFTPTIRTALLPIYPKPTNKVSFAPPQIDRISSMGISSREPEINMRPIAWDNVANEGVFPIYGEDNRLQGTWDRSVDGQINFYPRAGQEATVPRGLPPNTIIAPPTTISNVRFMEQGGAIPQADQGYNFNNPYVDNREPFNYGSSQNYLQYANNPQQFQMQQAQPQQAPAQGSMSGSSIGGGIQQGVQMVGDVFRGINSVRNSIVVGGGNLLNGLLQDNHNVRDRVVPMADPTLQYQPQFNNMMNDGGVMPQNNGMVVNTSWLPGATLDMTPQEVQQLRESGYEFEVL